MNMTKVARASGLPIDTLKRWETRRITNPVRNGQGRTNEWSITEAVGVGVVAKLRDTVRGCSMPYAKGIIAAFGTMTENQLVKKLKTDGKAFVLVHAGKPILQGRDYPDWPDVEAIYKRVLAQF